MSPPKPTNSPVGKTGASSMSDVAARAGVALGTVSNALNYPHKVAEGTLLRIQAAIDELGFVRNDQARSLARGQSSTMGLIVTDNQVCGEMIDARCSRLASSSTHDRAASAPFCVKWSPKKATCSALP